MSTPDYRLAKKRDFNLILKHGQWVGGGFLTIKLLKLANFKAYFPKKEDPDKFEKQLRIAFSVGFKIDKKAVARNRVKRQLREVVRLLIKNDKIKSGYYLMFVPKPAIKDKNYTEISQEVELLLRRASVLRSE